MRGLAKEYKDIVGVYLDPPSIVMARVTRTGRGTRLVKSVSAEIPKGATFTSLPEEIKEVVKDLVTRCEAWGLPCVLVLGRPYTVVKFATLPWASKKKFRQALILEGSKAFPVPESEIAFDCLTFRSDTPGRAEVMFFGARKSLVVQAIESLKACDLDPLSVIPVTSLLFQRDSGRSDVAVAIHVGGKATEILASFHGRPFFSHVIPVGAGVCVPEADAQSRPGDALAGELEAAFRLMKSTGKADGPLRMVLLAQKCAGERIKNLRSSLENLLHVSVDTEETPFSPAQAGVSEFLRRARRLPDLIPRARPDEATHNKKGIKTFYAGILAFILLIMLVILPARVRTAREEELKRLETHYAALKGVAGEARLIGEEVNKLGQRAITWEQLLANRPSWLKVLQDLRSAVPEGVELETVKLDVGKPVTLSGKANENSLVAGFLANLEASRSFFRESLGYVKTSEDGKAVDFVITCYLTGFSPEERINR